MLRLLYFFLIFYDHSFICQGTPLIGEGARLALENEFPFVVSLSYTPTSIYDDENEESHSCSGSLITTMHVLTAAHCIDKLENKYSDIIVKVGSVDWRNAKTFQVQTWIGFIDWAKADDLNPDFYYDVAIVTLKTNVSSNIRLPSITGEDDAALYNRKVMTAGWGTIENDVQPRYMKTAELTVLEPGQCPFNQQYLLPSVKDLLPKMYFCSKGEPPVILGTGDSGGPLLVNKNEIIAINSNCYPDADVEMCEYRNIHPTINFYKEFIASVTNNNVKIIEKPCTI